ncbi:MAG: VOC family protein [Chloroflexi bacterium]|nr:MAG: VOC family protein [Chloroflexota bacterium]
MPSAIDHLAVAVPDPAAAADLLAERLGISFSSGGQHPGMGTVNRVAFLGDPYLELIGVIDPGLADEWPIGRAALRTLERGGGLATYGLVEDELEAAVARLQAAGSPIDPITRGSRQRADGELVEWWSASPPELGPDRPPFLIKHARIGSEWGPEALEARREMRHPIGSPAILVRLDIATPDPPALAAEYLAQIGIEFWAVADLAVSTVGPHTIRLVPSREMEVPAVVVIGADVAEPRTIEALGLRFDVEPVKLPAVLPTG